MINLHSYPKKNQFFRYLLCVVFLVITIGEINAQTFDYTELIKLLRIAPIDTTGVAQTSLDSMKLDIPIRLPATSLNENTELKGQMETFVSQEETHSHIPTSVTVNISKDVGEIPIQSSISPIGGVTYSAPVDVIKGRNGLQPGISIDYNSHAGNNILGYGWSIGGLTTITRTPYNLYYNNKTDAVQMNVDDPLTLNGTRLLRTGAIDVEYESEQDNMRIKPIISGNIIRYFTVDYPNGMKATLGFTSNNTNQLAYPITRISDALGNYMEFNYDFINNHYYIKTILYGASSNSTHFASINFSYKDRLDITSFYESGIEIKETLLLDKIKCYSGNELIHTYSFTYTQDKVSLLKQIDCDNLNPLQCYYGYNNQVSGLEKETSYLYLQYEKNLPLIINKGKFDYGTNDDALIMYPKKNIQTFYESGGLFSHSKYYYISGYNPSQELLIYQSLNSQYPTPVSLIAGEGFTQLLPSDIDGKPGEELIQINNTVVDGKDRVLFKTYTPNLYAGLALKSTMFFDLSDAVVHFNTKSFWPKLYFAGDYNGDGKMELLGISMYKPLEKDLNSRCFLFNLDGKQILYNAQVFNFDFNKDEVVTLDFDGDGKTDILHINASGTDVYSFAVNNGVYTMSKKITYAGLKKTDLLNKQWMLGDVNGDGKIDIAVSPPASYNRSWTKEKMVYCYRFCPNCGFENPSSDVCESCNTYIGFSEYCYFCDQNLGANLECPIHGFSSTTEITEYVDNGSTWNIYYSTGTGFIKKEQSAIRVEENDKYIMQDVNFDGMSDLIRNSHGYTEVFFTRSGLLNANASETVSNYTGSSTESISSSVSQPNFYNFMLVLNNNNSELYKISSKRHEGKQRLLTGLINSMGVVQKNYYQCLNDENGSIYSKGYDAVFPYENYVGPLWVTSMQENYLKNEKIAASIYNYQNAIFHRQGFGFKGYQKMTYYDLIKNRVIEKTFDPQRFNVPVKEVSPESEQTFDYSISVAANKKATICINSVAAIDKLKGITVNKQYQYDSYNNPISETIDFGNGLKTVTSQTYDNIVSTADYIIGLPKVKNVTSYRNGLNWNQSEEISYYSDTRLPQTKVTKINGNKIGETKWEYYSEGNLKSEESAPYMVTDFLSNTYTYDATKRYVATKTNAMGRTVTYSSYNKFGSPLIVKDQNDNSIFYEYDALGRQIQTNNPDGTIMATSFIWSTSPANGLYCVIKTATGQPTNKIYYDNLGRKIRISSTRFDGSEIHTDNVYDYRGRLKKTSLPFKGTNASLWNTMSMTITTVLLI